MTPMELFQFILAAGLALVLVVAVFVLFLVCLAGMLGWLKDGENKS